MDTATPNTGGGILNIPFVTQEANAAAMRSTFWIQELAQLDVNGEPRLWLQYSQTVFLDFLGIRWPHVSINTLEKVVTKHPS